jgi:hypothetical protein
MIESFTTWLSNADTRHSVTPNFASVPEASAASNVKFGDFAHWFVLTYHRMFTQKVYQCYMGTSSRHQEVHKEKERGQGGLPSTVDIGSTRAMRCRSDVLSTDSSSRTVSAYGFDASSTNSHCSEGAGTANYYGEYSTGRSTGFRDRRNDSNLEQEEGTEEALFEYENPFLRDSGNSDDVAPPIDSNPPGSISHCPSYSGTYYHSDAVLPVSSGEVLSMGCFEKNNHPSDYPLPLKVAMNETVSPHQFSSNHGLLQLAIDNIDDSFTGIHRARLSVSRCQPVPSWYDEGDEDDDYDHDDGDDDYDHDDGDDDYDHDDGDDDYDHDDGRG